MLISRKRKFIFIHIYKNAGTSVMYALAPYVVGKCEYFARRVLNKLNLLPLHSNIQEFPQHIKASELIGEIGKEAFDSYFSFAIVRNPWDWQVSLYKFALKDTSHYQHDLIKDFGSFDKYIRWRCQIKGKGGPQKEYIYSENGELLVDFVARFESLEADFKTICSHIGISASLPKLNISNEIPYQEYYSEETKELVRQTFDIDITTFGYDF